MTGFLADAHIHLFSRGMRAENGGYVLGGASEVAVYESYRRVHNISAALVVGYEADGIDPENNRFIRKLANERPWIATLAFVPVIPSLERGTATALLAEGHSGISVYLPEAEAGAAVAAWPDETWRALGDRKAVVSFNARPEGAAALAPLVERQTGCTFLFSHLGLPGHCPLRPDLPAARARIAPLLRFAELPWVMVKVSGLYAIGGKAAAWPYEAASPFVDLVLSRFGASRCLWASDFSPALEHVSFAQTVENPWLDQLTQDEHDQVMGGNLLRLLGRG